MSMGIKGKFFVIVLSILVVPPLTIGIQLLSLSAGGVVAPQATFITIRMLAQDLQKALLSGDFTGFERLPPVTGLTVTADDGTVLYVRGPQPVEGSRMSTVGDERDFYSFRFSAGGRSGTVTLGVPAEMLSSLANPARILPITMVILLALVSIFSLFILRSLSRSMRRFEGAIEKIAAGDLDFPTGSLISGDFASLGTSLDSLRLQLKDDRERRDRFIMGVSHDLKTPLAVIQGYLDALEDGLADTAEDPGKKRAEYVNIMRDKADLLGRRIARLVDLAKTTTDAWLASLEQSDFRLFLDETLSSVSDYCTARGHPMESRIDLPSPCPVSFDRDMIARVLENLVDNAVAYGDPAVPILVTAEASLLDGSIVLLVQNDGAGILPDNLKRVFEPFFRGDRSRNTGGFGLGLASVKSIIETHGWSIDLESEPGVRTSFIITIPTAKVRNVNR
jgi:signal transduction histidine kinase